MIISVIGAGSCNQEIYDLAEEVGKLIALNGAVLVTGGLGGVMEAASKGAREAGGITVGILPGFSRDEANSYIDIPITTGLSHARNVIVARSADALIAISGGYGTLSEIALALKAGCPIILLNSWSIAPHDGRKQPDFLVARTPEEAVSLAIKQSQDSK